MIKKLLSICMVSCLALTMMVVNPTSSYAQEKNNTMSSNTIITENNIYDVLDYLGVDSSDFEKGAVTDKQSVTTVGQLQKVIKQASNQPKRLTINNVADSRKVGTLSSNSVSSLAKASKSKTLSYTAEYTNSYSLMYSVSAAYTDKKFTSASNGDVDITSDILFLTYKLSDKSLETSCTSEKIVLKSNFNVNTYVSVAGAGLVKVNAQKVDSKTTWYAKNEL